MMHSSEIIVIKKKKPDVIRAIQITAAAAMCVDFRAISHNNGVNSIRRVNRPWFIMISRY